MKVVNEILYNAKDIARIREVWMLIKSHPADQHSLESLAITAGLNRNKLVYGFRQHYGQSIHQLLITVRMEAAKAMLLSNDHPVKKIAQLSGYSNPANFITAFKKYTGKTPGEYKRDEVRWELRNDR